MALDTDGLEVQFGKSSIDRIGVLDSEIKELGDTLALEGAYSDGGFPTAYAAALDAVESAQETEKSRLEVLMVALRSV
jgi:hypothetical protein